MSEKESNQNIIRKFFNQSSHYLVGNISSMLAGFISLPILTRIFSRTDYGIMSLVSTTLFLSVAVAKFGLQHSSVRFYNEFKNGKRKDSISVFYTTLFLGALFLSLGIGITFWLLAQPLVQHLSYANIHVLVWIITGLIVTNSMTVRLNNFLRVEQKTKLFNIIGIFRRYGALALGIGLVIYFSKSLEALFSGMLLIDVMTVFVLTYVFVRQGKIKLKDFSIPFIWECILYGFPLIAFELASFLIKFSDRYLIQAFLGSEAVGVYSVGSNLAYYVKDALCLPVWYAIFPLYMELFHKEGKEKTREFIAKVSNYLLLIAIPIIFGLSALAKPIVITLATTKFEDASIVIPFIVTGAIIWGFYPIFAAGLYIYKRTKILALYVFIAGGLNVVLNIILIPRMHLLGAALATFIAYLSLTAMVIRTSYPYLRIHLDGGMLIKSVAAAVLMFSVVRSLKFGSGLPLLLTKVAIGAVLYFCVLTLLNENVKKFFLKVFHC